MTAVQSLASNVTGLRYSEETSLGVADGSAVWKPFEPNSYNKLGADIKTVARNPINQGRQRFKGVTVDLDAAGGFNTDLTQTNLQDIMQGFFFADLRRKGEEMPTAVNGSNAYLCASTAGFQIGNLVFASGFTNAGNTGLKNVTAVAANTSVTVSQTLVTEASPPSGDNLVVVGHQFGSSLLNVDATATIPTLLNAGVAGTSTLTLAGNAVDAETVTIGTKVYTWQDTLTNVDGHVKIGATASDSIDNLIAAINLAAGAGTLYAAATTTNVANVIATAGAGDTMVLTSNVHSASSATVATTETMTAGSWNHANLTGGTGVSFTELGLVPGEWIYIGGDTAPHLFLTAANNGWGRIRSVTDTVLTLDKTSGTMVDETGTGLTVQLFFGRVLKNESDPTLIKRRTYQLERTLGAPDSAQPAQIQSEYLVGAVGNTAKFNFQKADKITLDLDFVATDRETRTGATGVKPGTRPVISTADAFNTTSHFSRLKMAILDPANSNPTALFAFVSAFDLTVGNNVVPNKAIGRLGAFDVTAGQFNVDGTATAYFADVTAANAARNNSDVTLDFAIVKNNTVDTNTVAQGVLVDVPLIGLGGASLNVVQDQPIELPLTEAAGADRNFNHTLLMQWFDYLPQVAVPT